MNISLNSTRGLLALSALALASPLHAQITGFAADFNADATTYTGNFQRWNTDPQDPQGFTWGSGFGVGGGGGLRVDNTAANNLFYGAPGSGTASTFNVAGLSAGTMFSSSIDFQWASTTDASATALTTMTFGLAANRTQTAMSSTGSFGGSILRNNSTNTVTLRMRNNNANATTLDFNQSALTAGSWYRLGFDFTKNETTNEFGYTVTLFSIGADGTSTPVLFNDGIKNLTISGTISNSAIYADADAFFGFDIRDTIGNTGITHVDNFTVSVIPEPSAYALLAGGFALGVIGFRRRRVRAAV